MPRPDLFYKENNELSPTKVMLTTGLIAGAIILSASAITAAYPVSAAGVIALALVAAALAAGLLYYVVIAPVARGEPAAPAEEQNLLTTVDPLTRTLNRRGVTSSLLEGMAQAQRYSMPLSVALVSIDQYRKLADRKTPKTAETALQGVAQTITEVLRLPDRVGRQDNGEFLVVMPQTKIMAAAKVAERIRAAIESGAGALANGTAVTVSLGVAEFNKGQDLERFLSNAQAALAQARETGNQVVRHKAEKKR